MQMGRCYSRMDRTIEAQNWYHQAIEKDKDGKLWELPWMIGREYIHRNEWALAYEYLDQARVKMQKKGAHMPQVYNDLAIAHFGLDQFHSAYKELMNVRAEGYEPDPGFLAKVKKMLQDQGVDPDEEDKQARATSRQQASEGEDATNTDSGAADDKGKIPADPDTGSYPFTKPEAAKADTNK